MQISYAFLARDYPKNNETIPLCILCEKTFGNDSLKPSTIKYHLIGFTQIKKRTFFFKKLNDKFTCQLTIRSFMKQYIEVETEGELIAS